MRKGQSLQQMVLGAWTSTCKWIKFDYYLIPYTKINSRWIEDLNTRHKAIKILEENTGKKLHDTGFGNDFLDMTPKVQAIVAKID